MKKVLLRGPLLTQSGYGIHGRQCARWLLQREERGDIEVRFNLTPWGATSWILDRDAENGMIGKIMDRSVDASYRADVAFMLQLPNEWRRDNAPINVGMTAGVETDVCNPRWIQCLNAMSKVIVPSQHVKRTFETTAQRTNQPLHTLPLVVPEAYPDECEAHPALGMKFSTDFNLLVFGQLTGQNAAVDRKNTFNAIKWICEEFKNDPHVGIVLKTNMGTSTALDRQQTTSLVKRLLNEVRANGNPKVHLVHGNMTNEEVVALYKTPSVKALVTATRGEGFCLPVLEAAACGLPVIATGWSGHLDYLDRGRFISLDSRLVPVPKERCDGEIFVEGASWAEVNELDFKRKVRRFFTAPVTPRMWAKELSETLRSTNSFAAVAAAYDEATRDVL